MRKLGWFRLWVVLTIVGVPAATIWQYQKWAAVWEDFDKSAIHACVEGERYSPRKDALACAHRLGTDKSYFERERTRPLHFWSIGLAVSLIGDLLITGLILGVVLTVRCVARGFRTPARAD